MTPAAAVSLNWEGLAIGLATFFIIGLFHPIVIKGEYYFGRKILWAFLVMGIAAAILALIVAQLFWSAILAVVSFSSFWSIHEVLQQEKRVARGWFPANPKRKPRRARGR